MVQMTNLSTRPEVVIEGINIKIKIKIKININININIKINKPEHRV